MTRPFVGAVGLLLCLAGGNAHGEWLFEKPTNLGPVVNSAYNDGGPSISSDGLSLFFASRRSPGSGNFDLWVTNRTTLSGPWGTPVNLGTTVNLSTDDRDPGVSSDGLSLFFGSWRSNGWGNADIWVTTRESQTSPWITPVNLGPVVNGSTNDLGPNISSDGLTLFFNSNRSSGQGGADIWFSTRDTLTSPWKTPVNLGPTVNSSLADANPNISSDGLSLFFNSTRSGNKDLWVTNRTTLTSPWGTPVNLGPTVNSAVDDGAASISSDGSLLLFHSGRQGGQGDADLWQARFVAEPSTLALAVVGFLGWVGTLRCRPVQLLTFCSSGGMIDETTLNSSQRNTGRAYRRI